MPYGVVWLHDAPESGKRKLVSAPESIESSSAEEAKTEGMQILREVSEEHKSCMKPLSIVEMDDRVIYAVAGCERVFLPMGGEDGENGEELEFADVSNVEFWAHTAWWSK